MPVSKTVNIKYNYKLFEELPWSKALCLEGTCRGSVLTNQKDSLTYNDELSPVSMDGYFRERVYIEFEVKMQCKYSTTSYIVYALLCKCYL